MSLPFHKSPDFDVSISPYLQGKSITYTYARHKKPPSGPMLEMSSWKFGGKLRHWFAVKAKLEQVPCQFASVHAKIWPLSNVAKRTHVVIIDLFCCQCEERNVLGTA